MKVLHVITGLRRDGAQSTLLRLATELRARGIASRVLALGPREGIADDLETAGIPVTCLDLAFFRRSPAGWPAGLCRLARAWRAARAGDESVFAGWMYHGNLVASLLSWGSGRRVPVVWNIRHAFDDAARDKRLTRLVMRLGAFCSAHPACIVYNAHRSVVQHATRGYRSARAVVIANGVAASVFAPPSPERRAMLRARLPGLPDAVWVGMVARPHPVKDHAGFVEAAALLSVRFPFVRFLLVGRGLGTAEHPVRALVRAAGLEPLFHCRGELEDPAELAAWIGALDVAVSASRAEGSPNAVLEAMACGVPVVATDAGNTADLLGDAGIVVPAGDAAALAAAIGEAVSGGEAWRRARAAAGLSRARRHTLARMVGRHEEVLRKAAAGELP